MIMHKTALFLGFTLFISLNLLAQEIVPKRRLGGLFLGWGFFKLKIKPMENY